MLLLLLSGYVSGRDQVGTIDCMCYSWCFIAGGTERNTHKDDPLTAANDAYGMQQVIPVYETII